VTDLADDVLSDSVGAALLDYLAEHNASLTAATAQWRATNGSVHQIRVAARRLRSAILSYHPLLDGDARAVAADLRWFGQQLSELRDLEIMGPYLHDAAGQLSAAAGTALDDLVATALLTADRRAGNALHSTRFAALRLRLRSMLEQPVLTDDARTSAADYGPARVRHSAGRLRHRIDVVSINLPGNRDTRLHDVRKAAKRLRYTVEVTSAYLDPSGDDLRIRAENVQTVLGHHQDRLVAAGWWRRLADRLTEPAPDVEALIAAELSNAQAGLVDCGSVLADMLTAIDAFEVASV
jgi:CHAD domain-containing protein